IRRTRLAETQGSHVRLLPIGNCVGCEYRSGTRIEYHQNSGIAITFIIGWRFRITPVDNKEVINSIAILIGNKHTVLKAESRVPQNRMVRVLFMVIRPDHFARLAVKGSQVWRPAANEDIGSAI